MPEFFNIRVTSEEPVKVIRPYLSVEHEVMAAYSLENRGTMVIFKDFVKKALTPIREDTKKSDQKLQEGCGTSCE